ncbi:MAG: hypothetical protein ACLQGJ_07300 [Candidatus Dormibacteria bacterium]
MAVRVVEKTVRRRMPAGVAGRGGATRHGPAVTCWYETIAAR